MKRLFMNRFPLPVYPPYGMTSDQFADCQEQFTSFARGRILLGKEYDHGTNQRVEELDGKQIVNELREEIADAVNYLTALDVFLSRIPEAVLLQYALDGYNKS